jgi:hypothetical protein
MNVKLSPPPAPPDTHTYTHMEGERGALGQADLSLLTAARLEITDHFWKGGGLGGCWAHVVVSWRAACLRFRLYIQQ